MNIKLQLGEVRLLIDKRFPIEQISNQLKPIAKQANLIFAEHQVGAGYLQWALPGANWTAFSCGSNQQKVVIAQVYKERKNQMQKTLEGSFLKDVIFSVPSEDFIYFRQDAERLDIALTAWGYKYPDKPATGELDTWISKQELQKVDIAFAWNGQTLPSFSFKLSGHTRITSQDGFLHVDGLLPVGSSYSIETLMGQGFTLVVEKGKTEYIFDLTQYCQVEIAVSQDGNPLPNHVCDVSFGSFHETLTTDMEGHSQVRLPLKNDSLGQIVNPQPSCMVVCGSDSQQQIPTKSDDVLYFRFDFKTQTPVPPDIVPPLTSNKQVRVKVEVYRNGEPVPVQTSTILCEGDSHIVTTDEKGEAYFDVVLRNIDPEQLSKKQALCEVICGEEHQSKRIESETANLVFHFDLPPKDDTPKEPEFLFIQLKDYAGVPLIDMPFYLTTKKKGRVQLQTDQEGKCKVPKEWFTSKEKMKIDFTVSVVYQETHDIHDLKNRRKK
ncbi:MAG: hypothetical protein ACI4B3_09150 [Prevotella sp.]